MPKISVIMGIYNSPNKEILIEAIESILNQTFSDFEFIICDDGSTDDTYSFLKDYIKKDKRCKLISNERNSGLAYSLNHCLSIAQGEYIARMDSDDISLETRFENEVNYLDDHSDVAVVGTQAYYIDNNGKRYKEFKRKINVTLKDAIKTSNVIHPSAMMRKSVLLKVNGYTVNTLTTRAEDYDLWCKILSKGYKINNLNDFLFEYREDYAAYKKRTYKHRIEEYKIKKYWIEKESNNRMALIYALKPLIVGLIPGFILKKRKVK